MVTCFYKHYVIIANTGAALSGRLLQQLSSFVFIILQLELVITLTI